MNYANRRSGTNLDVDPVKEEALSAAAAAVVAAAAAVEPTPSPLGALYLEAGAYLICRF